MEHHRLVPMKPGYNPMLFEELYERTKPLRRKLAFEIDARKFGVDYLEILSWFDVKFIYTFNKYFDTEPKRLLGYIINALQTYKYRVMRSSYQIKYHEHAHMLDITELYGHADISEEVNDNHLKDMYLANLLSFMREKLSDDAMFIFELETSPPAYITYQLTDLGKKENSKIPHDVIADYIGYSNSPKVIAYISDLRKDIRIVLNMAKEHFKQNPISTN